MNIPCSVVIPSLDRLQYLHDAIADLAEQTIRPDEVIIVLQGSVDKAPCPKFLGSHSLRVRIVRSNLANASLARNIGLRVGTGEVVVFLDDDVRIKKSEFLRNHLRHYADSAVSGVYGQVLEVDEKPVYMPEPSAMETDCGWMSLPANYARPCRTRNGGSGNLSVRREWALAVGGMDAWFEKGARREETEFNLRYTRRFGPLIFDPEAGLTHLSAGGGSRMWGHVRRVVPMHHIVGHWYFLLRILVDRTLGARGIFLELRHIAIALLKNPQVGWNPLLFFHNAGRAAVGFGIALFRVFRGPKRIDTLDANDYREVASQAVAK